MAYNNQNQQANDGFVDKLVTVRRVAKTVKGGRRMSLSAVVVVGDENGRVGWGSGKAKETPDAVRKATDVAKRNMVRVPLRFGRTLHHEVEGQFAGSRVILRPAVPGKGIIAGGPMRAVFEAMGIKDVVAKSQGSNNPFNMIQATFEAFKSLENPRAIAAKRGKRMTDFVRFKEDSEKYELDQSALNEELEAKKKAAADKAEADKKAQAVAKKKPAAKKTDKPAPAKKAEPQVKVEKKADAQNAEAKTAPKAEAEKKDA